MIIDALCHVDEKFGWKHTAEVLIPMLDEAGIDKAAITTYFEVPGEDPTALDRLIATLRAHPDKFIAGFIRMNPFYGQRSVDLFVESVEKRGIKGLKFHASSCPIWPNHPFTLELVRKAGELEVPVYFHGGTDPMSLPQQIGLAAKECPKTSVILGHFGGFFYYEDAIRVAKKYKNIYLDTSLIPYPSVIRKGVDLIGADRIVFSSDAPGLLPRVELGKLDYADLTSAEREKILCTNIAGLLGISV